jgi:DNA-binding Lrp family transcriptional regulator
MVGYIADETDKAILNTLMDNSRLSYRQIAKKVGVSVATVMHRVNNLEKQKIIKKYTANLDYEKLGYDIVAIIEIKISKGKLEQMENKIASNENVISCYDVTGDFDSQMIARFRNRKGLDSFLKKIQTFEFVERTRTNLVLNVVKEEQNRIS